MFSVVMLNAFLSIDGSVASGRPEGRELRVRLFHSIERPEFRNFAPLARE
jgi:hypothetical protein